jgi:hypothetical protein
VHDISQYISTDAQLDPEGEYLPWGRFEESHIMWDSNQTCSQCQHQALWQADEPITFAPKYPVMEAVEDQQQEAADLAAYKESGTSSSTNTQLPIDDQLDPMVGESLDHLLDLHPQIEGDHSVLEDIWTRYTKDPLCSKVLQNIGHHKLFEIDDGLIYTQNWANALVLCILSIVQNKHQLTEIIISQSHEVLRHLRPQKTVDYIQCHYW